MWGQAALTLFVSALSLDLKIPPWPYDLMTLGPGPRLWLEHQQIRGHLPAACGGQKEDQADAHPVQPGASYHHRRGRPRLRQQPQALTQSTQEAKGKKTKTCHFHVGSTFRVLLCLLLLLLSMLLLLCCHSIPHLRYWGHNESLGLKALFNKIESICFLLFDIFKLVLPWPCELIFIIVCL